MRSALRSLTETGRHRNLTNSQFLHFVLHFLRKNARIEVGLTRSGLDDIARIKSCSYISSVVYSDFSQLGRLLCLKEKAQSEKVVCWKVQIFHQVSRDTATSAHIERSSGSNLFAS